MKCPACGHDMGKSAKCLRCGYTVKSVIPIDPEKIEEEQKDEPTKEIDPDQVRVTRNSDGFGGFFGGGIFDALFGGGVGGLFGSLFGDFFGEEEEDEGYTYDPKYYDDFGNEIRLPDEFERESVEVQDVELVDDRKQEEPQPEPERPQEHDDRPHAHGANAHPHGKHADHGEKDEKQSFFKRRRNKK